MISPAIRLFREVSNLKEKKREKGKRQKKDRGILKLGFAINGSLGENFSRKKLPLY